MKHKFSLILFLALLSTTFAWAQTTSAYYEVPAGAFFAGMTDNSGQAAGEFYVPYLYYSAARDTFRSTTAGYWQSTTTTKTSKTYTYANKIAKNHIPQLQVTEKKNYQYGASSETYDSNLYFYIGDSVMRYMTPARLWTDLVTNSTGYQDGYGTGYKTTNSDTMGVYFNNIDTMYIDGISIPIAYSSSVTTKTEEDLFPDDDSHVKVTIYPATITTGGLSNVPNRDIVIWTGEFTKAHFKPYADDKHYRGALDTIFKTPISINGAFVIELSEMNTSGCVFYVLSDKSNGKNKWGYYVQSGKTTYPANYCLAVSVHGMFPTLYTNGSLDISIDAEGGSKKRTVFANYKWIKNKNGWKREDMDGVTMSYETKTFSADSTEWYFKMDPNTTGAVREGDVTFKFRGKELAYHVTQAAPTFNAKEEYPDTTQTLYIPFNSDDTVCVYNESTGAYDKVSEIYIESEVTLNNNTISVSSKKGLTKIWKYFYNTEGHSVCLRLTRENYVSEDTKDTVTISFLGNPENKYEYTILHEGAGEDNLKLRPNGASRIFVAGPKGDKIRVLDEEKESLTNLKSIRVYSGVPASKLKLGWYENEHLGYVNTENRSDEDGEYKLITPHVETTTEEDLLDSFYVCLPEWDTVKFYIRQEASARIWRDADLTKLEIGEAGGTAHVEGNTKEEVIIISNTPMEDADVSVTCAGWITPTEKINEEGTKDTVRITFKVDKLTENENRTDDIVITVHNQPVEISLTQKIPAFYDLPNGAFLAGMTNMGELADKTFYLPYDLDKQYTFTSKEAGTWTSEGGAADESNKKYSYTSCEMKESYHIPQLTRDNTVRYQYGATDSTQYDNDLYFHVGDSVMHYMTPAKLWCDLVQKANGQAEKAIPNYHTKTRDTIGVFFNNTDVMYIDSISIPISFGGSKDYSLETMFPSDAIVYAKIYQATTKSTGKSGNKFDRNLTPLKTIELTKDDFFKHPNYDYRGALTAAVGEQPLAIIGSFVIELTNLKKSGCSFYIYAAQERPGCNKWGYYVDDEGDETYPDYTPAISVHAMFPALYPNDDEDLNIEISAEGETVYRTVFANCKYEEGSDDWSLSVTENIGLSVTKDSQDDNSTVWKFVMEANETTAVREGDVTFTFRGKTLTYHVTQAAPEPAPTYIREGGVGNYGTLCFPYTPTQDVTGADFYKVLWFNEAEMDLVLEQITGQPQAAVPYIFQYTNTQMVWAYDQTETPVEISTEGVNGLYGVASEEGYTVSESDATAGTYLLSNNKIVKAAATSYAAQYRAYLKLSEVSTEAPAGPASAPRIHMTVPGNGTPTNLNGLNGNVKATKVLRDGQLIIIRDGKTYNAQGIEL